MTAHPIPWPEVIADAVAAPSVHNTQPWRFVVRGDEVELHLDPERLLPVADPDGREARLSCGAALFNLRLALRVRGLSGDTRLLPDRAKPLLLAAVRADIARAATSLESSLYQAVHRRHSHRRPFQLQPVPGELRHGMAEAAAVEGATLKLVDSPSITGRVAQLIRQAERLQQDDPRFMAELALWTALDQLRAGQALQRSLLTATVYGAAANLVSQPIEVPAARAALRTLIGGGHPQLVLRIGMASTTATAPRRLASEVLHIIEDRVTMP